jgi:hypothetical protein
MCSREPWEPLGAASGAAMMLRLFAVPTIIFLGGCVVFPWPHQANVTPSVSGVLRGPDGPLVGVPVNVCEASSNSCCIGRSSTATTSTTGEFQVPPVRETKLLVYLMAHQQFYWCVSFSHAGTSHRAGPFHQYTLADSGPAFPEQLVCELEDSGLTCQISHDTPGGT